MDVSPTGWGLCATAAVALVGSSLSEIATTGRLGFLSTKTIDNIFHALLLSVYPENYVDTIPRRVFGEVEEKLSDLSGASSPVIGFEVGRYGPTP